MEFVKPIYEKLKNQLDSMNSNPETKEVQMLSSLVEAFGELEVFAMENRLRLDEVDEDLAEVENEFYGDRDEGGDFEAEIFEMICPNCHTQIYIDQEMLQNDVLNCPNCQAEIDFEVDFGDDGGCGEGGCGGCPGCGI